MPKNLTGSATAFPIQTAPLAGEPRTAESVESCLQNAADRAEYNNDRLTYIDPDRSGARRLRVVANITALKAIPSSNYGDGQFVVVKRVGTFCYEATATDGVAEPYIVKPNDVGGGPGRWVALRLPYSIVDVRSVNFIGQTTTTSSSYVNVPGTSLTFPACNNGDILELEVQSFLFVVADTGQYQMVVDDGASVRALPETFSSTTNTSTAPGDVYSAVASVVLASVGAGGSATIRMQFRTSAAGAIGTNFHYSCKARLIRP